MAISVGIDQTKNDYHFFLFVLGTPVTDTGNYRSESIHQSEINVFEVSRENIVDHLQFLSKSNRRGDNKGLSLKSSKVNFFGTSF